MKPMSSSAVLDPAAAPRLSLADFLPYRLNVLATTVSAGFASRYAKQFGIGIPEWRVLATIGEFTSITAKDVGHHSHMGKVKVSRAVVELEAKGLIARQPNPRDLREAFLVMTQAGECLYSKIVPLAIDYGAQLQSNISADDLKIFHKTIDLLLKKAQSMA